MCDMLADDMTSMVRDGGLISVVISRYDAVHKGNNSKWAYAVALHAFLLSQRNPGGVCLCLSVGVHRK